MECNDILNHITEQLKEDEATLDRILKVDEISLHTIAELMSFQAIKLLDTFIWTWNEK